MVQKKILHNQSCGPILLAATLLKGDIVVKVYQKTEKRETSFSI